ncbi:MAG: histidine triad protein [Candidatus Parcubacteria bacterium]|nr:HIT family protein [Patescibacteria group bacterium]BCX15985.1 MAG: histidine triad protein [Candidatus Parcubacteria bacterium]
MDCIFCQIIKKEKAAHLLYEDDFALAVLDIFPRAKGHTLVLPKKHGETILDFSGQELGNLFEAVKKVTALLKEKLKADGFTIGINHGKVSGQAIDHLHIHILPRFENDKGGSIHSVVNQPPAESLEEIRKIILS